MTSTNRLIEQQCRTTFKRYYSSRNEEVLKLIEQQVKESPCVLYMKGTPDSPMCGFSNTAVRILDATGANFTAHNVLADEVLREQIKKYSNWPTIPQLYVKGEFVGGADIMMTMYKSGELEKVLVDAGVVDKSD
eukprot:gene4717-5891_t